MNLRNINLSLFSVLLLSGVNSAFGMKRPREIGTTTREIGTTIYSQLSENQRTLSTMKKILDNSFQILPYVGLLTKKEAAKFVEIDGIIKKNERSPESLINELTANNNYAFRLACSEGHYHVVQLLIDKLREVYGENRRQEFNQTFIDAFKAENYCAFIISCQNGYLQVIQLLINTLREVYGENRRQEFNQTFINAFDVVNYYAFRSACVEGHRHVIQLLINTLREVCGKDAGQFYQTFVDSFRAEGFNALKMACKDGYLSVVQLLIDTLKEAYGENKRKEFNLTFIDAYISESKTVIADPETGWFKRHGHIEVKELMKQTFEQAQRELAEQEAQ